MPAKRRGYTERPNGQLPADPVVEEVRDYGLVESRSKFATMYALHRVPGARAEAAMLSLSRGWFRNCTARGGSWTVGLHVLRWTLERISEKPELRATDLWGPLATTLARTTELAEWDLLTFRLALVADVARQAETAGDRVGRLGRLVVAAVKSTPPGNPEALRRWLDARRGRFVGSLSRRRYELLRRQVHEGGDGS